MNKPVSNAMALARARHEADVKRIAEGSYHLEVARAAEDIERIQWPHVLQLSSKNQLQKKVQRLLLCGHGHHFKVHIDELRIIASEAAMNCMVD